jgi:general stress protein YciG
MASKRKNEAKSVRTSDETMTVQQAGELGGRATSETHGREFYEDIGHKGGQRVRELINEGKEAESKGRSKTDYDQAA